MKKYFKKSIFYILLLISNLPNIKGKCRVYKIFLEFYLQMGGSPIFNVFTKDKINIKIDSRSFYWALACSKNYEDDIIKLIKKKINIDQVFIDVGANIGYLSLVIAKFIKNNNGNRKVISFEPHPKNFNFLLDNIKLNNLENYIEPFNYALSDEETESKLMLDRDYQNGSLVGNASFLKKKFNSNSSEYILIKKKILDKFLKLDQKISFIKIDIEGHEDNFFRGSSKIIERDKPKIVFEIVPSYLKNKNIEDLDQAFLPYLRDYTFFFENQNYKSLNKMKLKSYNNIYCEYNEFNNKICL